MPIWNSREDYLREAVESVLRQTYNDFEYLILNDSPDNTALERIVKSYNDPRVVYIENEENIGIAASRNKLLELAKGEYVAVIDHDDIAEPQLLEKQVTYLDAHPEVGVVGVGVRELPSGKDSHNPQNDRDIRLGLMWGCVITHSSAMIRLSVLKQHHIRYEEQFSPSEDYALWCRLIPYTQFHNLPEVLFRYRFHANNTSKAQADEMERTTYAIRALVAATNPVLYREYLSCAEHVRRIRLFGVLPLLTFRRQGVREKVYLFDFLLLYCSKTVIKVH